MGYTTDFEGQINLSKPLTEEQAHYLLKFSETRRMGRNASLCQNFDDPIREMVELPIGVEGEFCVFDYNDRSDPTILDHNTPPSTQPGLWCQWIPTSDNSAIVWDGNEKFYYYFEWLTYIHDNMLAKWGITFTAEEVISYQGEEEDDNGQIYVDGGALIMSDGSGFNTKHELIQVVDNTEGDK